ncbi:HAD family hydrolase [Jatrophihabitans fulvus]
MTDAVIFDFYGTLTPGRSSDAQLRGRRAQATALGVPVDEFDAAMTATVDERFRGAGGSVEGSLRWICARLGIDVAPPHVRRAAEVRLQVERGFGEPRPDAVDLLSTLRVLGKRIGLVSDCSAELPTYFPDLPVAPYVDAPVFSFVTGHRKPDPHNFLACAQSLGVAPEACLYVGDGGSDELAGASRVGMRAVHLDVAEDVGGVVYGRHVDWSGDRITALGQVLDLV